jgi:hypothetical protein
MSIIDRLKRAAGGAATPKGRGGQGTGGTTERNVGGRVAGMTLRGRGGRSRRGGGPEDPGAGSASTERNVGG